MYPRSSRMINYGGCVINTPEYKTRRDAVHNNASKRPYRIQGCYFQRKQVKSGVDVRYQNKNAKNAPATQ